MEKVEGGLCGRFPVVCGFAVSWLEHLSGSQQVVRPSPLTCPLRALVGTLSSRVKIATAQVISVGALPIGFQRIIGMVCSRCLPGGLHDCEGAAIIVSALNAFRAAVERAVWSKKLPMTLLSLLDGAWGSDPVFFIIWSCFRQHRRYLVYRPDDVIPFFRLLDCASTGFPGHGPIHLLVDSAQEIDLFWDSEIFLSTLPCWIRPGLPSLRMMTGPIQHFRSAIWQAWQDKVATYFCTKNA